MPTQTIKVRHRKTGHTTDIPARVLAGYRRRGWEPVDELDRRPDRTSSGPTETATPDGADGTTSSDDSKETGQ